MKRQTLRLWAAVNLLLLGVVAGSAVFAAAHTPDPIGVALRMLSDLERERPGDPALAELRRRFERYRP